jgi:hypothetical protein
VGAPPRGFTAAGIVARERAARGELEPTNRPMGRLNPNALPTPAPTATPTSSPQPIPGARKVPVTSQPNVTPPSAVAPAASEAKAEPTVAPHWAATGAPLLPQQPSAPLLGQSFDAVGYTQQIPPDPSIAAGPNNIVVGVNSTTASTSGLNVYTKTGTLQANGSLQGFFGATDNPFDPWVVYDPYLGRFWALAASNNDGPNRSTVHIALSNTSDGSGIWSTGSFDATQFSGAGASNWCDYEKLGFDAQAIYITCNMFAFPTVPLAGPPPVPAGGFQQSIVLVLTKDQFLNNTCCHSWIFRDMREPAGSNTRSFTLQPARMYGAALSDGMFLVSARAQGANGNVLDVWHITNAQRCCTNAPSAPDFVQAGQTVGSYSTPPPARQSGSAVRLDTGDSRLLYAIWRSGRLTTGQNTACGPDACVGVTELNVGNYPAMTTLNDWTLGTANVDYYYPALDVNGQDDRTMVYSRSSTSQFAGSFFVGIPSSTVCNTCFDAEATLLAGQTSYVNCGSNCTPPAPTPAPLDRWGDYFGASSDPDGVGIWIFGQYASATANQWTTRAGLTRANGPPANDDIGNAIAIAGDTVPQQRTATTTSATTQRNERLTLTCNGASKTIGKTAWYSFTTTIGQVVTVDTLGSNFDTMIAVYTGTFGVAFDSVTCDDDSAGNLKSRVQFGSIPGTTYWIQVGGFSGASGNLVVNFSTPPPTNDNFASARAMDLGSTYGIVTLGATTEAGEPQPHDCDIPGPVPVGRTTWYTFVPASTMALTIDTTNPSPTGDRATYDTVIAVYTGSTLAGLTLVACNDDAAPDNVQSRLTFSAQSGTTYRVQVGGYSGAGGELNVNFSSVTLTETPGEVAIGDNLTATWSGIPAPSPRDWLGVYRLGAADAGYEDRVYVSCTTAPGTAYASGSCNTLHATSRAATPLTPGEYELRLFSNDTFTRLATSRCFRVNGDSTSRLCGTPAQVLPGGQVRVDWSEYYGGWIGAYPVGAPDSPHSDFVYTSSCTRTDDPFTVRVGGGACDFPLLNPLAPGTYEFRLFQSGNARKAVSNPFAVCPTAGPCVSANAANVAAGGNLGVAWQGIAAPQPNDQLALFPRGSNALVDWLYVSCTKTLGAARAAGACNFPLAAALGNSLPAGPAGASRAAVAPASYEVRLVTNNGTTLATSDLVSVCPTGAVCLSASPASVPAGGNLDVVWSGIPSPTNTDWIGLFAAGAADTARIAWVYVSCSTTPSTNTPQAASMCTFRVPTPLASGVYELRLYANDGLTRLATSDNIIIAGTGPTPAPTTTAVPTATVTPTPTATATRTATPTATPYPRPNVGVQVVPSAGTLQSTITARDAGCSPNNQLQALQITRLANATLDVATAPVTTVSTAPFSVTLPSHPASIGLTVHRLAAGQPVTVELTVTDGCGTWPTFIGGGASAF